MSKHLDVGIKAVKAGAKIALKHFNNNVVVNYKKDNSPVSQADTEVEEKIKEIILNEFPDAKFLGEESGGDIRGKEFWVIDPIDGTRNYVRNHQLWGILLAFVKDGQVVVGVSCMPIIKELLWAEAGKGAFLNNKKVKVSDYNDLSKSYLHYGRPTYFTEHLNGLLKLIGACNGARGLGDLYSYHLLASGRIDINIDGRIAPWDVAPFSVIVKEAGGRITDFEGKDWSINDSRALASNGLVHEKVLKLLTTSNDDR